MLRQSMEEDTDEVGVIKVFKTKTFPKKDRHNLPIILVVRLKKGALPVYTNYKIMRENYPNLLLQFFQKRIIFRMSDSQHKTIQDNLQFLDDHFDDFNRQQSRQESAKISRNKKAKKQVKRQNQKQIPIQVVRQNHRQISNSSDSRPVRSCRFRNQLKQRARQMRGYQQQRISRSISQSQNQSQRLSLIMQKIKKQEQKPPVKKILDYDYVIQLSSYLNLISPAVIPIIKQRHDPVLPPPPQIPYQLQPRINFNEMERERYSSEEFKQSEESQFVLDQRGKQKRRKQKLMREQEKLKSKKKIKRIKKKKKIIKT